MLRVVALRARAIQWMFGLLVLCGLALAAFAPRWAGAVLNPPPGGPILVITSPQSTFGAYYGEILRNEGLNVTGPLSADTAFHAEARATYDAILCMYHDQALIPVKTLDFHGGINVSLGLPFIRTSPDHGTALGIAGVHSANPKSLIAAIRLAAEMARAVHV